MKYKNEIKVAVLEDSEYFNKLMQKRILDYSEMLDYDLHREIAVKIKSYLSAKECLQELEEDTDLVYADFFLEDKITAWDLLNKIKEKCKNCKIVIMSQSNNIGRILNLVHDENITFIFKDEEAFIKGYRVILDVARAN